MEQDWARTANSFPYFSPALPTENQLPRRAKASDDQASADLRACMQLFVDAIAAPKLAGPVAREIGDIGEGRVIRSNSPIRSVGREGLGNRFIRLVLNEIALVGNHTEEVIKARND